MNSRITVYGITLKTIFWCYSRIKSYAAYKHTQPESWYTVSQCLSINMKERCQAVVSQYSGDNMPSLYISEVQLSPKWHIDNNIHSCCIETKGEAFLIIDKQHIFTFSFFQNDKSFKLHSASAVWRCPYQKLQAYLFVQEALARKYLPLLFQRRVKPLTNLTWYLFIFWFPPFMRHISSPCTGIKKKMQTFVTLNVDISVLGVKLPLTL